MNSESVTLLGSVEQATCAFGILAWIIYYKNVSCRGPKLLVFRPITHVLY